MSGFRSFTYRFLESVAEVVEVLSYDHEVLIFPSLGLIVAFVLTVIVSFSRGFLVPLAYIVFSFFIGLFLRVKFYMWIKPVAFTFLITSIASLPMLFMFHDNFLFDFLFFRVSFTGVLVFFEIVLRAVAAASIFTVILVHLGWRGIVYGLWRLRFPSSFIFLLAIFIKYVPVFLRDAVRMMAGREARTFSCGLRVAWRNFASVVGDLFLRAFYRSWRLQLAFKARGFNEAFLRDGFYDAFYEKSLGFRDLFLILLAVLLVVVGLIGVL